MRRRLPDSIIDLFLRQSHRLLENQLHGRADIHEEIVRAEQHNQRRDSSDGSANRSADDGVLSRIRRTGDARGKASGRRSGTTRGQ